MRSFYPEIEPYDTGMLDAGDAQQIYWETSGNPSGKPVVFLHGGPGAGTNARHRRLFDPERYRIVLLDQRGCGRSTPHAGVFDTDLSTNTTWHLVADLELLREHLDIDRWQVFGGSWGSTLALAYAETHPDRVTELVLRGIFTLRSGELEWFYEGAAANIYPDLWESYLAPVPEPQRVAGGLIEAYSQLLADPDPAVHGPAAVAWATWEASCITLLPQPDTVAEFADPTYALAFARIENHYFVNHGWLTDDQLIRNAAAVAHIPTVIVQGRYDMCTPATTAWDLHVALPDADFQLIPDAGHAFDEPGTLDALITATDRFAS
jgi:proline iminopeptidase